MNRLYSLLTLTGALLALACTPRPSSPPDEDGHALWLRDTVSSLLPSPAPQADNGRLVILNHWDNPDGTVERGYAGHSIWQWEELPDSISPLYTAYARACASVGINATVLNNVNAKPSMLTPTMLRKVAAIADVLRTEGLRVFLAVNFATPMALGELPTADPLNNNVATWWQRKVDEIYTLIPDFGGFLVKANSEGQPGPMDFGRTHADGANLLADALAPHGGVVMWRAFVYAPDSPDRACQAYEEFMPLDGLFRDNVILQVKNGPIDFQPREPLSPLLFTMQHTRVMPELQITQEYLGESIHTVFLASQWSECFARLTSLRPGGAASFPGMAGVANIGDSINWCGSDMAQANWYAFGRLANDPMLSPAQIAREWLTLTYTDDPRFTEPMTDLLLRSYEAAVDYMMPMGLHHLFAGGHHYGPEPWCNPPGWRIDWTPPYYHQADSAGIGFDRTLRGSRAVAQYGDSLCKVYDDPLSCPEEYLLWFHHLPWTFSRPDWTAPDGSPQTLWQRLCMHYDRGVAEAQAFVETWRDMRPYVDERRWRRQAWRFERQARDAVWWRDACLLYFQSFHGLPLPDGAPATQHTLDSLMRFHLPMDNYTAATPALLP